MGFFKSFIPQETYEEKVFKGERPLFGAVGVKLQNCVFEDGESPLKESKDIELYGSMFRWKYPLWYCDNVLMENGAWLDGGRAGAWYSRNIDIRNTLIQAPKTFRRSERIMLENVSITNAAETFWNCSDIKLKNVTAAGDYFAMNSENIEAEELDLDGKYAFDGVKNVTVRNSRLVTKDAFWNSENVTVFDSYISSEYLGWNSVDLTFVNCTIESLQGLCYIDGLKLVNCRLLDTTLAFEYTNVDADITGGIGSVFNPGKGRIKAARIGELIMEDNEIDPADTVIECDDVAVRSDKPEWKR
ncbi:MAG: DUF3737 family protein [Clostridia bacterium]|nr:DUF3737 family protein [Clostridia bacterium]